MRPQGLARRLLPARTYKTLHDFATHGCAADCGPPWTREVIEWARQAGPHVSALSPENLYLIWDDVGYQERAGFVNIVPESELFGVGVPESVVKELKISRLAVVPQADRRRRLILNLSAQVELPAKRAGRSRHKRKREQPSVNETTEDADDQDAVQALGSALPCLLRFMFEAPSDWEIEWQKIDLSDGFWRMIVERGKEYNFVYQLPPRPGDRGNFFVIPSSLQMGWKNSPAYFCTATEGTRELIKRILALSLDSGIDVPHRHEGHCSSPQAPTPSNPVAGAPGDSVPTVAEARSDGGQPGWVPPRGFLLVNRVFVDDFMNGLAGAPGRKRRRLEQTWVARAALHGIHAVFPPPDVLEHEGGRDSVSTKKLAKGDARFKLKETMLGFDLHGAQGRQRTVGLSDSKCLRYRAQIRAALARPGRCLPLREFQKIHGRIQHAAGAMPCMRGFMTPLNRALASAPLFVGLGKGSEVRETLADFDHLLGLARHHPSHITEIVPPDLPHYYGYVDFSAVGMGGVWLPCTRWLPPVVWRARNPPHVEAEVRKMNGAINNNDGECAAIVVGEFLLDHLLGGDVAGVSTHLGSDNSASVGQQQRKASRATHKQAQNLLRWQALRQRWTRRGPADCDHIPGLSNGLGDIPSRSYEEGFPEASDDDAFLADFSHRFPLPPQLGSWRLAQPPTAVTSAIYSLLQGTRDSTTHPATSSGAAGLGLPVSLANTLFSLTSNPTTTTWNESTCSWPLLTPSGEVTSLKAPELQHRRSREHFSGAPPAWSPEDLKTLGDQMRGRNDSTQSSGQRSTSGDGRILPPGRSWHCPTPPCVGSPPRSPSAARTYRS